MTKLLRRAEVADRLAVTFRTVNNYVERGLIPYVVLPGGRRFPEDAVERFIADRTFSNHLVHLPNRQSKGKSNE